jgi:anti-sigma B factor antagonist
MPSVRHQALGAHPRFPGSVRIAPVPTELSIQRNDEAEGVVLTLCGELDLATAPGLEQRLQEILAAPPRRLLLDLSELTFVDSAGVSVLIRAKKEAEGNGCQMVLRRPTAQLHRVFALVGLTDWLAFEGS